jgi:uroporphyrinogen decarboxylase
VEHPGPCTPGVLFRKIKENPSGPAGREPKEEVVPMNSRERVLSAFGKGAGKPDRPPFQFDLCRSLIEHFAKKLGMKSDYTISYYEDLSYRISANDIRTALGSDCVVVGGQTARGFTPQTVKDDITTNEFGMHMKPTSLYVEVVKCPLETVESTADAETFPFPDPYAPGRMEKAERDIDRFGKDYFIIGDCELSLFELAWHLTGLEKYMIDMASGEEWIETINDKVEYFTTGIAEQLVRAGVDAIWLGEDLGSQVSTLISPDMWREMFRPRHERIIGKLRAINPEIIIIMHSDGAVAPLLDDFIEMGIDVYNPVQPNVPGSDPAELAAKYGGRISFFGGIDQQQLLPKGNAAEIEREMRSRAAILGKNGGYLMAPAHIIQADVAPETVETMLSIAKTL